ncbi:hypothetical protein PRZ48_011420 [Zasmidium cellare]|uniref:Cytochrome P450 n=1 Tax=Zasmidium cellare TaxID=395010 RepID=A0ABR0E6X7_ZASCE|nr:hypothetical protein PRZ48_011420 [Zasmidium cellare]
MSGETLLYALILLTGALVAYSIFLAATSPLRQVPGPFLARFTRLWYFRNVCKGQTHWDNIHLHRKYAPPGSFYAPVVRLRPNMYSISRPESVVYGIGSKMTKTALYDAFKHPASEPGLLSHRNQRKYAETRRKVQSMYSMSSLLRYERYVDVTEGIFEQRLLEMAKSGEFPRFCLGRSELKIREIGNITYSETFGFLDEGKDIDHALEAMHAQIEYGALVGIFPWLHPLLYSILEKIPGSGAAGRTFLIKFARRHIAEREKQRAANDAKGPKPEPAEGVPKDFLDLALDAEQDPEKSMTKHDVFITGLSNILAGADTTAVSLTSIFWHLTTYPQTMQRLRAELDQAIAEGKMTARHVTFKESQNLPYLQACIKEGLRMAAATGIPLWREVPKGSGGIEMLGHFFPEGSEIGLNSWVAHYDEDIWGPDAAQFKPERWIESDADKLKMMDSHFMPFGLGSRTCIGRHISMLEMCKVVPMIVSQFDFDLVNKSGKYETTDMFLVQPKDFRVVVRAPSSP